jgi:hypothetical protein
VWTELLPWLHACREKDIMSDDQPTQRPHLASRSAQVQASARGWHTVQLAVLGFVGICGVLKSGSSSTSPRGIEELAGVLILVALAVACWATYLVGRAAWPLPGRAAGDGVGPEGEAEAERPGRRLRAGLTLTFVSVVLVSTAAASSWWPRPPTSSGSSTGSTTRSRPPGAARSSRTRSPARTTSGPS